MPLSCGWDWTVSFYQSKESLKGWITSDAMAEFEFDAVADLAIHDAFIYRGFDHETILKKAHATHAAYTPPTRTPAIFDVKSGDGTVTYSHSSTATCIQDIKMAVTLFLVRGNSREKIVNKSATGLRELVEHLEKKLGISFTKNQSGQALDPSTITLPRLSACFPLRSLDLTIAGFAKVYCDTIALGFDGTMTKAILSPLFCGVVPFAPDNAATPYVSCHAVFFLVHLFLDETIHKKPTETKTTLSEILVYYLAAFRSPLASRANRLAYCRRIGVVAAGTDVLDARFTAAKAHCEAQIAHLRPTENHAAVIAELNTIRH